MEKAWLPVLTRLIWVGRFPSRIHNGAYGPVAQVRVQHFTASWRLSRQEQAPCCLALFRGFDSFRAHHSLSVSSTDQLFKRTIGDERVNDP